MSQLVLVIVLVELVSKCWLVVVRLLLLDDWPIDDGAVKVVMLGESETWQDICIVHDVMDAVKILLLSLPRVKEESLSEVLLVGAK